MTATKEMPRSAGTDAGQMTTGTHNPAIIGDSTLIGRALLGLEDVGEELVRVRLAEEAGEPRLVEAARAHFGEVLSHVQAPGETLRALAAVDYAAHLRTPGFVRLARVTALWYSCRDASYRTNDADGMAHAEQMLALVNDELDRRAHGTEGAGE